MNSFTYYTPTKVIFGEGTVAQVGQLVKSFGGTKVLLHYGGRSAEKSGLLEQVKKALEEAGLLVVSLGGVQPNPRLSLVHEGIALAKEEGVDFILAVGGGSVMDSAKAIGYGLAYDGDVWDLYDMKAKPAASFPVGAIPTVAASGSEMSDSSVITKDEGNIKRGVNSDFCRMKFAVMDPALTVSVPVAQTMEGCADIMMHTMERYFTSKGNLELTDGLAEALLRTVMKNAVALKEDPANVQARAEIMWASSLSHNNLTGCGNGGNDFATHKLELEISGLFDVPHAAGVAAVWPTWARYVVDNCLPRFYKFAVNVMGVAPLDEEGHLRDHRQVAMEGIDAMEDFFRTLGLPVTIGALGIQPTEEDIQALVAGCKAATGNNLGSAQVLHEEDFLAIYKKAL